MCVWKTPLHHSRLKCCLVCFHHCVCVFIIKGLSWVWFSFGLVWVGGWLDNYIVQWNLCTCFGRSPSSYMPASRISPKLHPLIQSYSAILPHFLNFYLRGYKADLYCRPTLHMLVLDHMYMLHGVPAPFVKIYCPKCPSQHNAHCLFCSKFCQQNLAGPCILVHEQILWF